MINKLNYEIGRIPFEAINVDEVRERDLHRANQLWIDGKYKGALLCYDSVISDASKQLSGPWDRMSELRVAYLNKLQLLQKLFRANKLWTVDDCRELLDLYDDYIKKLDEVRSKARRTDIRLEIVLDTKSRLVIEKGKLIELLTNISTAMPIYETALSVINELITLDPTDDLNYYNKGIHLSRMRRSQEALEVLRTAKELSTSMWLLDDIEYAIQVIQKGSYFF